MKNKLRDVSSSYRLFLFDVQSFFDYGLLLVLYLQVELPSGLGSGDRALAVRLLEE